jgi:hypothetical protein
MPEEDGGFFGSGSSWQIIIPLVVLIAVSFIMRRRRSERNPQEIATSIILDLNADQKIIDEFDYQKRPKKLKTGSWKRNEAKVNFLDESIRSDINKFFSMADDFNLQVDSAKRYGTVHLSSISVERMKEPLTKSREALNEWLKTNMEQAGPAAGRSGCLGGGFGG